MKIKCLILLCNVLFFLSACSKDSTPEGETSTLTAGEATAIGRSTATISGSISVPAGSETRNYGFLYSTVASLPVAESKTISIILNGTSGTYTATLTELKPNTKYYYCLYANNGYTTTRSDIREFTTVMGGVPALEATTSVSATETSLTLACKISDDGGYDVQKFGFAYKKGSSDDTEKMVEAAQKDQDGKYTFTITGLEAETSYEVRAFAINSSGTAYNQVQSFKTLAQESPIVSLEVGVPNGNSVNVTGILQSSGGASAVVKEVGFCWSIDNAVPTTADNKLVSSLSGTSFNGVIAGLKRETTYYIRSYAINETKTGYSEVVVITTPESNVPEEDDIVSPDKN